MAKLLKKVETGKRVVELWENDKGFSVMNYSATTGNGGCFPFATLAEAEFDFESQVKR